MKIVDELFNKITKNHTEAEVHKMVDEVKPEYVYDWEDEFDDIHEAYQEQGRGEAESWSIHHLIEIYTYMDALTFDESVDLIEKLAEHYGLNLN